MEGASERTAAPAGCAAAVATPWMAKAIVGSSRPSACVGATCLTIAVETRTATRGSIAAVGRTPGTPPTTGRRERVEAGGAAGTPRAIRQLIAGMTFAATTDDDSIGCAWDDDMLGLVNDAATAATTGTAAAATTTDDEQRHGEGAGAKVARGGSGPGGRLYGCEPTDVVTEPDLGRARAWRLAGRNEGWQRR